MNTARDFLFGTGTKTAALAAGGGDSPRFNNTEEWYGDGKLTETFTTS